jgi:hypothetical protein
MQDDRMPSRYRHDSRFLNGKVQEPPSDTLNLTPCVKDCLRFWMSGLRQGQIRLLGYPFGVLDQFNETLSLTKTSDLELMTALFFSCIDWLHSPSRSIHSLAHSSPNSLLHRPIFSRCNSIFAMHLSLEIRPLLLL